LSNIFDLHSFAINKYRVKKDQMFQIRKTNKIYDWSRLTLVHHEHWVKNDEMWILLMTCH